MNPICTIGTAMAVSLLACASCQNPAPRPTATSLTVYPVLLAGQANSDVAVVVGSLLERGGMPDVQVADATFTPTAAMDLPARASAFAAFVQQAAPPTQCALFVDIHGTRQAGIERVQAVLVGKDGAVLWQEQHRAGEAVFDKHKPKEPLDCCIFGYGVRAPRSLFRVGSGRAEADLDGDGVPESFQSCASLEGLHPTVWSGEPLRGVERWSRYYYMGYDLEPNCPGTESSIST